MKRYGMVIRLKPGTYEEYKRLHQNVPPEVLHTAHEHGIRNQTIFYRDGYLFRYFEYVGDDFEKDMAALAPSTSAVRQRWWELTSALQEPLDTCAPGEWWALMDEAFHGD